MSSVPGLGLSVLFYFLVSEQILLLRHVSTVWS